MNSREEKTVAAMRTVLTVARIENRDISMTEFIERVKQMLLQMSLIEPYVTPKLMGSYLRKYFKVETERRGNGNIRFLIIDTFT